LINDITLGEIPIQRIHDNFLSKSGIRLSILRLDLIHPEISGNKWFKLKYNLECARNEGRDSLLSFGGPWSNHLHALAYAGQYFDFSTIGLVRGELPYPLNACLQDAKNAGMELVPVSRADYKNKDNPEFAEYLKRQFGNVFLIPEGGANKAGVKGCKEIINLYPQVFDLVCIACGTGTTLAGMASTSQIPLLGFQVLKGKGYIRRQVNTLMQQYQLSASCDWNVCDDFHFGGYAKVNDEFLQFLTEFEQRHGLPLEPVYSGKILFGLYQLFKKRDFFPQNYSILAIHGGGLQGARGFL
jgi:1-aminocyclopropane-1-carboxylate deaminase